MEEKVRSCFQLERRRQKEVWMVHVSIMRQQNVPPF
jgi:hypothetical protein